MKKLCIFLLSVFLLFSFTACAADDKTTQASDDSKLSVSVSFNALYEFTKAVGKDKVAISTIIPTGSEPHHFEPKASDIADLNTAKVFIYNGLGMEPWAEEVINASENDDLITIIASDGADIIKNEGEEIEEHGQYDPHLWLSLSGAMIEVQNIADGLSKADPDNKDFYQANAKAYRKELNDLLTEYKEKFAALENKNFVTGHAAFHYFCNDFGLEQNSVEDVFAEGEPSTRQLADLVEYCKDNQVTTIFAEETASPEVSRTLADEVGASVKIIYTMEGSDDSLSYLERMKANCENIYKSLSQ